MKKVFSFTLDEDVIGELNDYCQNTLVTKSKLVNKIIKEFLKKEMSKNDINERYKSDNQSK